VNALPTCPDTLLVGARTRTLSPEDRARLDAHLSRCAACRATLDTGRAFDASLGAQPGDDEIARRIAARLTPRPKRRRSPYVLAAAIVFATGSVAAATVPGVWTVLQRPFVESANPEVLTPSLGEVAVRSKGVSKPRVAPPPIETLREASPPESEVAPEVAVGERKTAAELFADGNLKRRNGDNDAARAAYQDLQRQYPGSTEALVSHVSLGRLERGRSPAAALRHFDTYLRQSAHTTLAEEALFGKASALGALGRVSTERAAWRELLRRFPGSVYAERARARLVEPTGSQ
jgi:hypothetical protein